MSLETDIQQLNATISAFNETIQTLFAKAFAGAIVQNIGPAQPAVADMGAHTSVENTGNGGTVTSCNTISTPCDPVVAPPPAAQKAKPEVADVKPTYDQLQKMAMKLSVRTTRDEVGRRLATIGVPSIKEASEDRYADIAVVLGEP